MQNIINVNQNQNIKDVLKKYGFFCGVEADVEVGADYRQLSGTEADLSGCGWSPLGKLGLRSGASDLLQALACLADELQAARAPCGDWPQPICSLPLKRTELMC